MPGVGPLRVGLGTQGSHRGSQLLRRGEFTSRQHGLDRIDTFTIAYNEDAGSFRRTYEGSPP